MKKALLIFLIVFINIPFFSFAQGIRIENIPEPVTDLVDTFGGIKIDVGDQTFLERIFTGAKDFISSPRTIFSDIEDLWNKINDWFESKICVSFRELIIALGNFFIWALELIIKLLRTVVSIL